MKRFAIIIMILLSLIILSIMTGTAASLTVNVGTLQAFHYEVDIEIHPVNAMIDIKPDSFQLKNQGQPVNAFIELPQGFLPENIIQNTVRLSYDLNGDGTFEENESVPVDIDNRLRLDDHNHNGISDIGVAFNRIEVVNLLETLEGFDNISLIVTGKVANCNFSGNDTIKLLH